MENILFAFKSHFSYTYSFIAFPQITFSTLWMNQTPRLLVPESLSRPSSEDVEMASTNAAQDIA